MSGERKSCIVVGAGISGLLAARELQDAGWRVTVLDKGRGVGGRMATRRVDGATFDHGAQFVTTRGDRFKALMGGWLREDAAREWGRGFAGADGEPKQDGHPRYRGADGMASIPKHLARRLDVRTGERVVEINTTDDGWEVVCESGLRATAGALLLTPPVPQSLALAGSGNYEMPEQAREQLEQISYGPCFALLAVLDESAGVPEPGGMQVRDPDGLDWIGDNHQKGISEVPALTIHAGPGWSREHFDAEPERTESRLLALAEEYVGPLDPRETKLFRWRYSWVENAHPEPYLMAGEDPPLLFCGDAFGGAKVEGAALSGLSAADYLLSREV